jgi:hypothetical protein
VNCARLIRDLILKSRSQLNQLKGLIDEVERPGAHPVAVDQRSTTMGECYAPSRRWAAPCSKGVRVVIAEFTSSLRRGLLPRNSPRSARCPSRHRF